MMRGTTQLVHTIERISAETTGGAITGCTQQTHRRHDGLHASCAPPVAPGRQPSSAARTAAPLRSNTSSAQAMILRNRETTVFLFYIASSLGLTFAPLQSIHPGVVAEARSWRNHLNSCSHLCGRRRLNAPVSRSRHSSIRTLACTSAASSHRHHATQDDAQFPDARRDSPHGRSPRHPETWLAARMVERLDRQQGAVFCFGQTPSVESSSLRPW
jgi:hypothetical protein